MTVTSMQLRMSELSLITETSLRLWGTLLKLMPLIIYITLSYKIKAEQRKK